MGTTLSSVGEEQGDTEPEAPSSLSLSNYFWKREETDSKTDPLQSGSYSKFSVLFNWSHGGEAVYVTGEWDGWQSRIPLQKSQHDFSSIQNLPPGIYKYKYIVDGRPKLAKDQPVMTDEKGELANYIQILEPEDGGWIGTPAVEGESALSHSPSSEYGQPLVCEKDNGKPPAMLPPHLLRALLNTESSSEDPSLLPVPHHVMLNHLYTMREEAGNDEDLQVMILGATNRYRNKFVTYVYYKPTCDVSDIDNDSDYGEDDTFFDSE